MRIIRCHCGLGALGGLSMAGISGGSIEEWYETMSSDSDQILVDRRWLINDCYRENNLSFHPEGKGKIVDDIGWKNEEILSNYSELVYHMR